MSIHIPLSGQVAIALRIRRDTSPVTFAKLPAPHKIPARVVLHDADILRRNTIAESDIAKSRRLKEAGTNKAVSEPVHREVRSKVKAGSPALPYPKEIAVAAKLGRKHVRSSNWNQIRCLIKINRLPHLAGDVDVLRRVECRLAKVNFCIRRGSGPQQFCPHYLAVRIAFTREIAVACGEIRARDGGGSLKISAPIADARRRYRQAYRPKPTARNQTQRLRPQSTAIVVILG